MFHHPVRFVALRYPTVLVVFSCVVATCHIQLFARAPEYNRDIRPILADNCFSCHGADSAARRADLRLDQRVAAVEAGSITPGDPNDSEMISRIFADDPELLMPPPESKKQLTEEQKGLLKRWVSSGADYQAHWSFLPPRRPVHPNPDGEAWCKNPIDWFVLAKLRASGLSPAPEAGAHALFRRLHLDITGLPPLPKDVAAFSSDYRHRKDDALSEWIDKLMKSPAWGEHRARYWLDAARYADTHGLHFDNYREMWPYRDWVIRAFNANQPFDQFTVEQLAGDLLTNPTDDQLIATGFQRCNITTNEGGTIDEENLANYAVDRVQTFGWVFLGLTTNCGQCHDHKFDPFTMTDFYSLAAFFRNTTQRAKDGNVKDGRGPVLIVPSDADRNRWQALPGEIAAAQTRRDERKQNARDEFENWLPKASPEAFDHEVPGDGLTVHAPLNEGTGNEVANTCVDSQSIQATGDIQWIPNGKIGPAPVMKPRATFTLGPVGDFEKNQPFSCGAWVRTGRDNTSAAIIARMDENTAHRGWDVFQNGRSIAVHLVDAWPNNAIKVSTREEVVTAGRWQHVFVTYDGSGTPDGISIYVDGRQQELRVDTNTFKSNASIRTETPLRIGQRSQGAVFDGGAVQDVRIYDAALTDVQVKAIVDIGPLQQLLAVVPGKRSTRQQATMFEHYLMARDTQYSTLARTVANLEAEREAIRKRSPVTHIQKERMDSSAVARVLMRGEYDKPGAKVTASTPAALHSMREDAPRNRLGLAYWLVDPANPLTARVTVNRFWQEVFGQGIVRTPEDFGVMGDDPSHPELLDWLAVEFRESDWDVKRLFKLIFTSATYRQAATVNAAKMEQDRENRLLSRGPRFRMDAEMVRDYALTTSGLLTQKMYGPSVRPYQPDGIWDVVGVPGGNTRKYVQDNGDSLYRRTLYSFWKRMAPPPNLEAFNAPSREVCTVRRERTNTPLQALVTLNDPQFVEAARKLAELAIHASEGVDTKAIDVIARRALCRSVSAKELSIVLAGKKDLLAYYQANLDDARALISVGESSIGEGLDVSQLAAWTMVCNQFLNLDEALNK